MQESRNPIVNALELCVHFANPSIWYVYMSNFDNIYVVIATRWEVHIENVGSCMALFLFTITHKSPQCVMCLKHHPVKHQRPDVNACISTPLNWAGDIGCITKRMCTKMILEISYYVIEMHLTVWRTVHFFIVVGIISLLYHDYFNDIWTLNSWVVSSYH